MLTSSRTILRTVQFTYPFFLKFFIYSIHPCVTHHFGKDFFPLSYRLSPVFQLLGLTSCTMESFSESFDLEIFIFSSSNLRISGPLTLRSWCTCVCIPCHTCGKQRTTLWESPSIIWIPSIQLRSSELGASVFTH